MRTTSYTKAYLSIYGWQILSIVLGLLSVFIVIPFLSSNKILYGIYAICISLTMFYNYADIGFISAGQKYAAEYYAREDRKGEISIVSFTAFVLFLFFGGVSVLLIIIGTHPNWIIADLHTYEDYRVATFLILILAFSFPIYACLRILSIIYGIRLEDYKFQKVVIVGNAVRILAALFFFANGRYMLIEYFFVFQLIGGFVITYGIVDVHRRYGYSWKAFRLYFRFNKQIFNKVKQVAFASLMLTIGWVLYYELDQLVISRFLGAKQVAIFAIALAILTMFRTFLGALYGPFTSRFNHFIGLRDIDGLNSFYKHVVNLLFPLVTLPIIIVSILAKAFVLSWVGTDYNDSVVLVELIVYANILAFFSYPSNPYLISREKVKYLYVLTALSPFIFWLGILFTVHVYGIVAFAFWKAFAMILSGVYAYFFVCKVMEEKIWKLPFELLKNYGLPLCLCILLCFLARHFMLYEKGYVALGINALIMFSVFVLSSLACLLTSKPLREYVYKLVKAI